MNTTITTKSKQGGNPDQQNHNPQLHRKISEPKPKTQPSFFFNSYVETKLKDIQQLHKDKTQTQIFWPQTQNST